MVIVAAIVPYHSLTGQQQYTTKSKKAIDLFEKAKQLYDQHDFDKSIDNLKKAIRIDENFVEPYIGLADVYRELGNTDKAIEYLGSSIKINPDFFPGSFYNLADMYYSIGKYAERR